DKAQMLQEEVKKSIDDLVRFLDPWASVHQVRTQAQDLLEKQREAEKQTRKLELQGRDASEDEIKNAAEAQRALHERLQDLVNKMKDVAKSRAEKGDKHTAARLEEARKEARKGQSGEAMRQAHEDLKKKHEFMKSKPDPDHDRAKEAPQKAIAGLEKMIAPLEDRRDDDVQR